MPFALQVYDIDQSGTLSMSELLHIIIGEDKERENEEIIEFVWTQIRKSQNDISKVPATECTTART